LDSLYIIKVRVVTMQENVNTSMNE
jgi:hypothetical protein